MSKLLGANDTLANFSQRQGSWLQLIAWILFGILGIRFGILWLNAFGQTSLPVPGRIGFTVIFACFSLTHAISSIGWRRSLAFLATCVVVSWSFEEVGIATGRIYGPYHYGGQLGPKLGDVPLIIPFAWFMMVSVVWSPPFRGRTEGRV